MWMLIECDFKLFTNTCTHNRILSIYHVRHKIQSEQWVSANKEFKSNFLIRCLNTDNEGRSLIFLGRRLNNLGPMYLMECLPYVVVFNLGKGNSLFLSEYLVSIKAIMDHKFLWCRGIINHLGCWKNTRRRKSPACDSWFTNSSRVLSTFRWFNSL